MADSQDLRRSAPAAARNRDAILDVLKGLLPAAGLVLELASGTGEHIVHFARNIPHLTWQPSDPSPEARQSIAGWIISENLPNILPPLEIDAERSPWPVRQAVAILCINMIHISPWEATLGLMREAGSTLCEDGLLYLYGPYRRADRPLEPSNDAFDQDLRARDPRWGLRNLEEVTACAADNDLLLVQAIEMPANNISVIFRRS